MSFFVTSYLLFHDTVFKWAFLRYCRNFLLEKKLMADAWMLLNRNQYLLPRNYDVVLAKKKYKFKQIGQILNLSNLFTE